jgi:hypothetical protein
MGFKQTETHRYGKGSYHQIGLVRGQFGNVPMDKWLKFVQETGFDGWEEASWELDLDKCGTDAGAEAYAKERVEIAKKHGLEIFTVAAHLQGQALGDEPSAKTLQFTGGEAVQAYKAWRDKGHQPPRTDPYFVPEEVGKMIHAQATRALLGCVRLAHYLGKLQNRKVAVPSFVGSPAHCWSHFFLFPPLPSSIAGHAIPDVRQVSLELLVDRFQPVWDACKKYGVTYESISWKRPATAGWLASTSTARTWNGRACRSCSSFANSGTASIAPTSRACRSSASTLAPAC